MEKVVITLGREAMEYSLQGKLSWNDHLFQAVTTVFVKSMISNELKNGNNISVIEFSGQEVNDFIEFNNKYQLDSTIGLNDASVLYYAFIHNATVVAIDHKTEVTCKALGISIIKEKEITDQSNIYTLHNTNSHAEWDKPVEADGPHLSMSKNNMLMTG